MLADDFGPYLGAHKKVEQAWKDPKLWARMSIMSVAGKKKISKNFREFFLLIGMDQFSSDRSIHEYCEKIWGVKPLMWKVEQI